MKFAEADPNEGYFISSYDENTLQVNGKNFNSSLIIASKQLKTDWSPRSIETLKADDFTAIIQLKPELVIIGTGNKLTFPPVETYAELIKLGVGVEFMDTGAACRTYNILTGEGRHVVCGLI
ncbi:MAG: Mth938-like domain-containing protein, partial [Gammaproteobacteria bacterium]|nr:Mth938-like domain-containing protein [Gammaproteobacteria bacterium]